MEKLENKSSLFARSPLICCEMTLFKEELDQPPPRSEGKRTRLQLRSYHVPSVMSSISIDTLLLFLLSTGIVT